MVHRGICIGIFTVVFVMVRFFYRGICYGSPWYLLWFKVVLPWYLLWFTVVSVMVKYPITPRNKFFTYRETRKTSYIK